jgi:hypothetical protein
MAPCIFLVAGNILQIQSNPTSGCATACSWGRISHDLTCMNWIPTQRSIISLIQCIKCAHVLITKRKVVEIRVRFHPMGLRRFREWRVPGCCVSIGGTGGSNWCDRDNTHPFWRLQRTSTFPASFPYFLANLDRVGSSQRRPRRRGQ